MAHLGVSPDFQCAGIIGSGGGARGAAHVGHLQELLPALIRHRVPVGYIGGTSVGALNLSKIAESHTVEDFLRSLNALDDVWMMVEREGPEYIFPKATPLSGLRKEYVHSGSTLWRLVKGIRPLDPQKIVSAPRPFDVFVRNEETWAHEVISTEDDAVKENPEIIVSAVVAAASLGPLFPPVSINGKLYSDGLYIQLKRAIRAGCDLIFVLFPYRQDGKGGKPSGFLMRWYPLVFKFLDSYAAEIRKQDLREVAWALERNENIEKYSNLRKRVSDEIWLKAKKRKIDRYFDEADLPFQGKHKVKIVPVYIEWMPDTLLLDDFDKKKKDISRVRDAARLTMRRILSDECDMSA